MMQKTLAILGGIGAFLLVMLLLIGGGYVGIYNALNSQSQVVKSKWGDVDTDLQRRNDLIPNLVETVKGYASHEDKVFTEVAEARASIGKINVGEAAADPETMKQLVAAQSAMSGALSRLLVVAEAYPELKASQNFLTLQDQLEGTENRIGVSRKRYNTAVETYNTTAGGFFSSMVAGMNGFKKAEYFQADEAAKTAPKVSFTKE